MRIACGRAAIRRTVSGMGIRARARYRSRRRRQDLGALAVRIRVILFGLLILGGIFPLFAAPRYDFRGGEMVEVGMRYHFTWDVLEQIDNQEPFSQSWFGLVFIVLCPVLGLLALAAQAAPRRARATAYVTFGLLPAALIVASFGIDISGAWFIGPVGLVAGTVLVTGAVVALRRPARELGFRMCGVAGCVTLLLAFLPLMPDPENPDGANISAFGAAFRVLQMDTAGPLLFLIALTGVASNVMAATALSGGNRITRVRFVLWLVGIYFAMLLILPPIASAMTGASSWATFVLMLALLGLRTLPALGLLIYGATELILMRIPQEPAADPGVFA